MRRAAFLGGCVAYAFGARPAAATGGLDVGDPAAAHAMRVLLADAAVPQPLQLDRWHFTWNGRAYRGTCAPVALDDGRTGLVNTLPLDAYLYGVVSREVSPSWPASAQQAQAIVARTYALAKVRPAKAYDVTSGAGDQYYGGIDAETIEGRGAVDATAGMVVIFGVSPARVAYSSCCGGRTAAAADVWRSDVAYLQSREDPNCAGTPEYRWEAVFSTDDARRACGAAFEGIGTLRAIELRGVDGSLRPHGVAFVGDRSSCTVATEELRARLGASLIRSTFLRGGAVRGETLALEGSGRGHGVGMCQWGARMLGARGASASEIVQFYLPGTSFGRA
jgi:stage II sporulation protein D